MMTTSVRFLALAASAAFAIALPRLAASATQHPGTIAHPTAASSESPAGEHVWYGTVRGIHGARFELVLRNGRVLSVDRTVPLGARYSLLLFPGRVVIVKGTLLNGGVVRAEAVWRSHTMPGYWPADR